MKMLSTILTTCLTIALLAAPAAHAAPDPCRKNPSADGCNDGSGGDGTSGSTPPSPPSRIMEGNCLFTISGCHPNWEWVGYAYAVVQHALP